MSSSEDEDQNPRKRHRISEAPNFLSTDHLTRVSAINKEDAKSNSSDERLPSFVFSFDQQLIQTSNNFVPSAHRQLNFSVQLNPDVALIQEGEEEAENDSNAAETYSRLGSEPNGPDCNSDASDTSDGVQHSHDASDDFHGCDRVPNSSFSREANPNVSGDEQENGGIVSNTERGVSHNIQFAQELLFEKFNLSIGSIGSPLDDSTASNPADSTISSNTSTVTVRDQLIKALLLDKHAYEVSREFSDIDKNDLNSSLAQEPPGTCETMDREIPPLNFASTPSKRIIPAFSSQPYHPIVSPIKLDAQFEHEVSKENYSASEDETDSESDYGTDCESDKEEECQSDNGYLFEGDESNENRNFFDAVIEWFQTENNLNETVSSIGDSSPCNTLNSALLLNDLKLYEGSSISVNESILEIMTLYLKNKLSKAGLDRTINSMSKLLPENHKLPSSSHLILTYVKSLAPPVSASAHFYCQRCLFYHGTRIDGKCAICKDDTEFGRFFSFDISVLIKFFFEHRHLASLMESESEKRKNRQPHTITDLKDATVYQDINKNRGKYDVTFILSADGVRLKKGSKKEVWLAMITIAELPIHLQRSFLTVIGIWQHAKKPDMKTFLKPFAESMEFHDKNGIEWTHPKTGSVEKSCTKLAVEILDAPARAIVQNVYYFNGKYGCNICEIKAKRTKPVPGKKRRRVYFYETNPTLRTKERMLDQANRVVETGQDHVKGVRGPSVLSIIPSADISKSIVPEYLHSVLLGVMKQLLLIWTTIPGAWSIKGRISEIDITLKSCKHPDFVHRNQRQLDNLKGWKASDFYYFMFFEALPSLKGHLPDKYYQHFILLVKAIFSLLKSAIPEREINEADILLKLFVNEFLSLYGDRQQTHNVHQLTHLALCVRRFGPLFCFSAFPSEDLNGKVAKASHATKLMEAEIVNNIQICQGITILESIVRGNHGLDAPQNPRSMGEFLGKEVKGFLLSPEELNILDDCNPLIYARAKLGYDSYTSEIYKDLTTADFYVMWIQNGAPQYGSIKYFAKCNSADFVVIRLFTVDHTSVFYHTRTLKCIEHLIPVTASDSCVAVKFIDILPSIVKVGKIDRYVYVRPHLYRFVL